MTKLIFGLLFLGFNTPAFALTPGIYRSQNAATADLVVKAWGEGFSIESCANYTNIGCARFSLVVFRNNQKLEGNGTLIASYRGNLSLDCPYDISATMSETAEGKVYLALRLPRQMFSQVYRCPGINELGGYQSFFLAKPYTHLQ